MFNISIRPCMGGVLAFAMTHVLTLNRRAREPPQVFGKEAAGYLNKALFGLSCL